MPTSQEQQQHRAHALDLALRMPGIHNGDQVIKLATAYEKFIAGSARDDGSATASGGETITFDQFVQYGRDNSANIVGGMPWSFVFRGYPVSHENDRCYLIGVNGRHMPFTADQLLVVSPNGSLATLKADPVRL